MIKSKSPLLVLITLITERTATFVDTVAIIDCAMDGS